MADKLHLDFAIIHRETHHNQETQITGGEETKLTLVGDVKGKIAFLVDDILDGTHTFLDAAEHLKHCEAKRVIIVATHGILSGNSAKGTLNEAHFSSLYRNSRFRCRR